MTSRPFLCSNEIKARQNCRLLSSFISDQSAYIFGSGWKLSLRKVVGNLLKTR